jgi:hypothetical protein
MSMRAVPLETAAQLLTSLRRKQVSVEMLQSDIDAGAPLNPDGTFNLLDYAVWLISEMAHGD